MDLIFLTTGTGIALVRAVLESVVALTADQQPISVTGLWSGRHAQDFYLNVGDIPGGQAYFSVRPRQDEAWPSTIGHVQYVLPAAATDLAKAIYECGSDAMIHGAQARLVAAGLSPKRFYSDAFVCSGNI